MTQFKEFILRASGVVEWKCPHGIGHPLCYKDGSVISESSMHVHGCDGCCGQFTKEEWDGLVVKAMEYEW